MFMICGSLKDNKLLNLFKGYQYENSFSLVRKAEALLKVHFDALGFFSTHGSENILGVIP